MFPYKLGENGGAAFLIPYFIFVILLGTVGLIAEFAFGRQFKVGSMGAIQKIFKEKNLKYDKLLSAIPTISLTIPLLFIIFILLIAKSIILSGSIEGVRYLISPDWSYLLKTNTWVMALGQAFLQYL